MDERVLDIADFAGVHLDRCDVYNDLEVLAAITEKFCSSYKLHKIKGWYKLAGPLIGLELQFINPRNEDLLIPGPHVGKEPCNMMIDAELELDSDEYITEVRGNAI